MVAAATAAEGPLAHLATLKGRTILVTGHSGFIGSWLSTLLVSAEARVVGYSLSDDPCSSSRVDWLKRLGVFDVQGDVRDLGTLISAAQEYQPDLVIHLAAQAILRRGFAEPHLTFDVNLNGSLTVLEAVRLGFVPSLIHVTSDKCYAPVTSADPPISESAPLGGEGPYSASKSIAEVLFKEYAMLVPLGASIVSVRLGNVIGGGDEADRLVPNALSAFRSGHAFSLRDPEAQRPFQHILDVSLGMTKLASGLLDQEIENGLALNFAPANIASSARDLVAELARAWGPGAAMSNQREWVDFPEQQVIQLDGRRAAALLDWKHQFDLTKSALWIVDWANSTESGLDPSDATSQQVSEYLKLLEGAR